MTIGEIECGIQKVREAEFAMVLARWLEELLRFYGDRILVRHFAPTGVTVFDPFRSA